MKKIIVLGSGMIGRTIAAELSKSHKVTATDISKTALQTLSGLPGIETAVLNVEDRYALASAVADKDLVISAVPGFLGYRTVRQVIELKKHLVDISFMSEDATTLDELARENSVTAVTDCGIAPGMPNYIIGYHNELLKLLKVEYMVGGLPKKRTLPFEYKAPFSPADVLEEYTRPARVIENGRLTIKPAMSEPELVDFGNTGTLEAFNTDGLRSLLLTMGHIRDMKEKTLRYPGHIGLIKALESSGFFSKQPVLIKGLMVAPYDFTAKILFDNWKLAPGEQEFTVMRVRLTGTDNAGYHEILYDLYDETDLPGQVSSMARTTGYTACATAELLLSGLFTARGVFPPELIGKYRECFKSVMQYLRMRNVIFKFSDRVQAVNTREAYPI